ncbi:LysR family transcriptional regulator [Phaeobacter piscinae]|uniref:Transcriptional regulator n=1 Tax=Phaeobacter piscinae TaxID=1580596 RepID=A0ABM6PEI9_9RHOB|nr:LysR family transcriptional regulator [Phaeobacter piscinae]ATG36202.1 Transcriptional regulator [Phaeobacter piscinae]ATG40085.1 Transcriptional regulator [Phaeobacter piscinae]AUQ86723.1 Transcriptional regulator [Phaeobacter piscinae]AUR24606.1 Transcriptional regulator [Phaeobacter piscinae]
MLNSSWLETFTVLSGLESFTRTAARLNMTQPGVSQHVKKLEAQVGKPLLDRHGKGFSLTDAGAAVAALGRRRLAEEEALRQELGQDDPASGQVRIACPGGFAVLLYDAVAAHLAGAPGLMLSLQAAPQAAIEAQLLAGELDFGILHRKLEAPRLTAEPLGRDRLNLILPPDSPAVPDFDDLQALGMIGHPDGAALADRLLGANYSGYRGAAGLRQRAFLNQIGQILDPVAAGTGYTILPQTAVLAQSAQRAFRIAALAHPQEDELWLISQRRDPPPARLAAFAEAIRTVSGRLDQ